jgi:hypothetical protein
MVVGSGRLNLGVDRKRRAVVASALLAFTAGMTAALASGLGEPAIFAIAMIAGYFGLFLVFCWFQFDRQQRGFKRSQSFNVVLATFPVVVAPIYLYRTRSPGRRILSIVWFFAVTVIGWQLVMTSGMIFGLALKAVIAR